ncbi:MAG: hypothetical protein M1813_003678 [Trichoglossum hirsutum]|nr:MAG: hypothetical protein M1813_003678 [Trichoglossum hirsutum]
MDDWGSPWADDAVSGQLSLPRAVVPVKAEQNLPNANLEVQPIGNVLTGLERSSPWVGDGGLGQWVDVENPTAPTADTFPDWNAEVSTRVPLSQNMGEKGYGNVQSEGESVWGNEAGLSLAAAGEEPQWKSEPSHGAVEPGSYFERGAKTFPEGNGGEGEVDILHVHLDSVVPSTDQKNAQSAAVTDNLTELPTRGNFVEGDLSLKPPSSLAHNRYMEEGAVESPGTSLEETVLLEEQKLRSPSPQRPPAPITDPVPLKCQDSTDGGDVDFGDFEEEVKCTGDGNFDLEPQPIGNSIPHDHSNQGQETSASSKPPASLEVVVFAVDMSLLDRLIPQSHSADLPPPLEDEIISSTSSRKTWYRISRKETVREHSGNGDYVRVTWVGSSIQANVSKIVARWITEDRIAGGTVFGGSNRLGATFGWGEEMRRASEKPQLGPKKDVSDSAPPGLWDKTHSPKIMPHSPPSMTPKSNRSPTNDSSVEGSISTRMNDANPLVPQFGWGNSDERVRRLALDATRSTTSTHQKAASMISIPFSVSPVTSLSPLSATSNPSLQPRPASLDLSSEKTYKSQHTRGSKSVISSSIQNPRITSSTLAAIEVIGLTSQSASSIRDSSQSASRVELGTPEEHCNPWGPVDLPVFDHRLPTQTPQLNPQTRRELVTVDILKPNKASEDKIVERVIKGLPNLEYMLR